MATQSMEKESESFFLLAPLKCRVGREIESGKEENRKLNTIPTMADFLLLSCVTVV